MGLVGDWIRVFKGPDKYKTISNVKNPEIARLNTGLMGDFDRSGRETESSLSDFTSKYLSAQPTREAQTGQETGAIDRYYDGSFDSMLAGIRANRANALRTAGDRAIGYAARGRKSDSLLSPGGGSSYFDRLALGQTGDIEAKIALDGAEQEKQDLLSAEQARFNLLGRRGALGDATIGRLLYPAQLREQSLARRTAELAGLENIDLANTFYGLQKKRSSIDKAADIADLSERTIIQLAAMYFGGLGGVAGAAGGAGAGAAGMGGGSMGGGNMAAMAGMAGGLGGGTGAGNASLYGSQPGQSSWSFANMFKADGGPVEEGKPYVVGEEGAEQFVPDTNSQSFIKAKLDEPLDTTEPFLDEKTRQRIIAIGGLGSLPGDNFFNTLRQIDPRLIEIPLRGTGRGIAGVGIKNASDIIRSAIDSFRTNNQPVTVVGHSLGGTLAHNVLKDIGDNPNISPVFVDPPYDPPWQNAPRFLQPPTARAITDASRAGIRTNANTVDWTRGRTIMYPPPGKMFYGENQAHTPWNSTNAPLNQHRINNLLDIVRSKSGNTNAPVLTPRWTGGPVNAGQAYEVGEQGPEVFVPQQSGTIIPNPNTNPSFAPPIGGTDVALSPEEKVALLQLIARMRHGTQPNPAVDPQSGPWNAPFGPAEMAPQNGVWNEPSGPIDIASSAQPSQVPAKRQRDPQETRRRFEDILRNYQAFDTGPAPTSTPVGDSYSSVQAADDRGNQMRSQRTGIVAERINNLIQQRRDEEWKKAQEQTRRAEMADAVARRAQEETIRHKEASEQLRQGQERINIDKDRNKIYDRREIQAQTEQTTRDTGRDNSAEFNEAYQGVTSGLITSPEQLGGFRFLRPEQVQRLASYIGSVESQDREQDAYVTNATSAFNGRILNERRKKAQTELAAEKNKWKYGLSGKRDDDKITNLEEAIRTGEGLPPLKEGELQKYIDQLAKDRNLSQLGRFDEQTQMLVPILKAKPLSGAQPAPSTPAPAAAPSTSKPTFRYNRDGQLIR